MAGDWLKVEKETPDKPELLRIAAALSLSTAETFLLCFRLWCWADSHTEAGVLTGLTPGHIDSRFGLPGFAAALAAVGWLAVRDAGIEIPKFGRHMGRSAKQRALDARLKKESRTGILSGHEPDICPVGNRTTAGPEKSKRREDKREEKDTHKARAPTTPETPPETEKPDDGFDAFWASYPRKESKQAAIRAWKKLHPSPQLREQLMQALDRQKAWDAWLRGFAPHAATWLNGRRWEDEPPPTQVPSTAGRNTETHEQRMQRLLQEGRNAVS